MDQDLDRALAMYGAMCETDEFDGEELRFLTIDGEPYPKRRHRSGAGGRAYPDPKGEAEETGFAWALKRTFKVPCEGNLALGCIFYRSNYKQIDVDNMLKFVCDAGNGVAWKDDHQITAIMGIVEHDAAAPRTVLILGRHYSTMNRTGAPQTRECIDCGTPISRPGTRCRTHAWAHRHSESAERVEAFRQRLSQP